MRRSESHGLYIVRNESETMVVQWWTAELEHEQRISPSFFFSKGMDVPDGKNMKRRYLAMDDARINLFPNLWN